MKKILSLSHPQEVLSPRNELRMMLDTLASDTLSERGGISRTWETLTTSVKELKDMPFLQNDNSSQEMKPFSADESRTLLIYLKGPNGPKLSSSTQELANNIELLKRMSPENPECVTLLRDVLTGIVSRVSGKETQSSAIGSFFNSMTTDSNRGIKEVLLSETLKDVFSKFGDKCLEAILDVLGTSGRNKTDLMALYIEVKIKTINDVKSGYKDLLENINRDIDALETPEPDKTLGYVPAKKLFAQLDTVLNAYSDQLNSLEPIVQRELITSISHAFLTRFKSELKVFGADNKEKSADDTHLLFLDKAGSIDQPLSGYFSSARMADGMNGYANDIASQSRSLRGALDIILPLQNGITKRRNVLLLQHRDNMVAYGDACCNAVTGALETTGKNKTLLIPMYIEARLKAPEVRRAYQARVEARFAKAEKEKQEGLERRRLAEEKVCKEREAERAEEQRLRDLEFGQLHEANLKFMEEQSALKQKGNKVAAIDYASLVPFRYEDLYNKIYKNLSENFLGTFVRKCGDPQLTQEYVNSALKLILPELFNRDQTQLGLFLRHGERKAALNTMLTGLRLTVDRPSRCLIKAASEQLALALHPVEQSFKDVVNQVIQETLVNDGQLSRTFTLEEALEAVNKLNVLDEPNPHFVQTIIGDALGRNNGEISFNLHIKNGRVCSSDRVTYVYGKLNSDAQSTQEYDAQLQSNNILRGFLLKTLNLSDVRYHIRLVNVELKNNLNDLQKKGGK